MERQAQQRLKNNPPELLTLPVDLLQLVLGFLGVVDIARWLRPVCRAASALVARCPTVALKTRFVNAQAVKRLFAGLDAVRLTSLHLKVGPNVDSDLNFDGYNFPALKALWLSGRTIGNRVLESVLSAAPRLQILKLTRTYWLNGSAFKSIARLRELRCLWWPLPLDPTAGSFFNDGRLLEFGARFSVHWPPKSQHQGDLRKGTTCKTVCANAATPTFAP